MAFWDRFKRTPEMSKKSFTYPLPNDLAVWFGVTQAGYLPAWNAFKLARESSAVSVPVRHIVNAASVINPVIELPDKTLVREHPVLSLLQNPSPDFTMELMFKVLMWNYLITGNAYISALGSLTRPPAELLPFNTTAVSPIISDNGMTGSFKVGQLLLPGSYVRSKESTGWRFVRDSFTELKQIRMWSDRDGSLLEGQSPLIPCVREIQQNILGTEHNAKLLMNGGKLSLHFAFENDMSPDDFEEVKDRIQEEYSGASNAGKIAVSAGGKMKIDELGQTNLDMEYNKMTMLNRQIVANQYHYPLPLIFMEASTMNNYQTSKLAFYDDAVLPAFGAVLQGMTDFLFPRYPGLPEGSKLSWDDQEITALVGRRLDELLKRRMVNAETDNELRALMGRDDLVEGGDTVRDLASKVPIGEDAFGTSDNEMLADRNSDA